MMESKIPDKTAHVQDDLNLHMLRMFDGTVHSRYLEFKGTLWNISRYPYLDRSELRKWGKQ